MRKVLLGDFDYAGVSRQKSLKLGEGRPAKEKINV
jgi:hypothetical protein